MSKIPAVCKSFHSVTLKIADKFCVPVSVVTSLKSGTAKRTFSTPSPVPVRIQSWADASEAAMIRRNNIERATKYFFMPGDSIRCKLPPIVEPELDGDITARVLRRQRAKGIDALQRPGGRLIQRRNAAGLFHAY